MTPLVRSILHFIWEADSERTGLSRVYFVYYSKGVLFCDRVYLDARDGHLKVVAAIEQILSKSEGAEIRVRPSNVVEWRIFNLDVP